MRPQFGTIIENFYYWESQTPHNIYLRQPFQNHFQDYTFSDAGNQARRMAAVLLSLKLPAKSNIGILSKNSAHWIISDLAIAMAGHISVPFYPTLTSGQLNQVLVHSDCKVLFVGKLDSWEHINSSIPQNIYCISFPQSPVSGYDNWDDLIKQHEPVSENVRPEPEDIATIIYTSGTTGTPKGVMVTQKAIINALNMSREAIGLDIPNARFFSYLPLCHIAERNIVESASTATGGTVYFVESLETFQKNLQDAQPTHFLAVPRIWAKFQLGIFSKISPQRLKVLLKIPLINSLISNKIKKGLGLVKAQIILTGAAPMPSHLLKWYENLGISIREAYGMTENLGAHSLMPEKTAKEGTVGKPYKEVQTRIDPVTGEIQMKSPWNTIGYYKETILTRELLKDGWLCTGDIGEIDQEGYLKITGRLKDVFKSSKGEYIMPVTIENLFNENPYIEQICVMGSNLPQPVALVVLSDIGKAVNKSTLVSSLTETIQIINTQVNHYEHIRKVIIVKENWSVENNLITPTMKIKRNVIEAYYESKLQSWYANEALVSFE